MYGSRFLVCYANMIAYASFVNSLGCVDIYLKYVLFEKKFSSFYLVVFMYGSRFLVCYANMIAYASFVNSLGCGFDGITKLQLL